MKILVTGTSGFVGGNLSSILKKEGFSVLSAGRNKFSDIFCDFTKPESFQNIKFNNIDAVIHCAGPIDEDFRDSGGKPDIHAKEGTKALVELVKSSKVINYIHFSTAHVYGELKGLINEKKKPRPISNYAKAHLISENIAIDTLKNSNTNCCICRPCAIYDLPSKPLTFKRWHLIPYSFPSELFLNKKLVLKTSGLQYRNFVSMESIAKFLIDCLIKKKFSPCQKINLVGAKTISVKSFANICQKVIKKKYNFLPLIIRPDSDIDSNKLELEFSSEFKLKEDELKIKKFIVELINTKENENFKALWQKKFKS